MYAFSYHSCPDVLTSPVCRVTRWGYAGCALSPENAIHKDCMSTVTPHPCILWLRWSHHYGLTHRHTGAHTPMCMDCFLERTPESPFRLETELTGRGGKLRGRLGDGLSRGCGNEVGEGLRGRIDTTWPGWMRAQGTRRGLAGHRFRCREKLLQWLCKCARPHRLDIHPI